MNKTKPENVSWEASAFYEQVLPNAPNIDFTSLQEVKQLREAYTPIWKSLSESIPIKYRFDEIEVNGISCFISPPPISHDEETVILYIHGGSLIFGHPTICKNIPVSIAHHCGYPVVSIAYPLAPENSLEDMIDCIHSVFCGLDKYNKFGLIGDSAGAGLALSSIQTASKKDIPLPKALALLSPTVDYAIVGDSILTLEDYDPTPLSKDWLINSVYAFIGNRKPDDAIVSPIYGDLRGLCPTYIQQAGRDKLSSNAFRLNRRLLDNNVDSTLDVWDGMWHGFQMFPSIPEAQDANKATANFFVSKLT